MKIQMRDGTGWFEVSRMGWGDAVALACQRRSAVRMLDESGLAVREYHPV